MYLYCQHRIGVLYHCVKFGWNSFHVWVENTYSHPKIVYLGWPPRWTSISTRSPKVTNGCKNTPFELNFIKIYRTDADISQFFSPLSKPANRAIYFTFRNFFLLLNWAKLSQDLLERFSRFFHQMEGICLSAVNPVQFFWCLKGRCHGNQFYVVADLFARSQSISESAGPIFTIFAQYGRYWIADDQSDPLFPISWGTLPWQPI